MAEVVVFHHALGLTGFVGRFAASLRDAGHAVHAPDLFDGRMFETIDAGMAYADELGGPTAIVARAHDAVDPLPGGLVYVGFSLGVLAAQSLAQTRPGARGAVLCYSAVEPGRWGDDWPVAWPAGVPLEVHILDGDEDHEIAKRLVAAVPGARLFAYPGVDHYFAEHDDAAAAVLTERACSRSSPPGSAA